MPDAARAARIEARLLAAIAADEAAVSQPFSVRTADRQWTDRGMALGLEICVLYENERGRAVLVRMQPGSALPPHDHGMDEESLILEGDACIGDDLHLGVGDYHYAPAGSRHPIIRSPGGCVVYVRGDRAMRATMTPGFIRHWLGRMFRRWR